MWDEREALEEPGGIFVFMGDVRPKDYRVN